MILQLTEKKKNYFFNFENVSDPKNILHEDLTKKLYLSNSGLRS